MDVPRTRIELIAEEKTGITADTARRLSKALGTTPQLWLNLQTGYDLPDSPARSVRNLAGGIVMSCPVAIQKPRQSFAP